MQTAINETDHTIPAGLLVTTRDVEIPILQRSESVLPQKSIANALEIKIDFKLQDGYQTDLTPLLSKARSGDHKAFDRLTERLCPLVRRALKKQGANADDAEDALSSALLIFYRLMTQGRFDAMQTGGVIAYFRKVALHEWLHRPSARKNGNTLSLVYCDAASGEEVTIEPADTRAHFTEKVENRCLYEFLVQQLDEVFVGMRTGPERFRGELEKLSFICYYQDGMTQNEIFVLLNTVSANCSLSNPVTRIDLNNWLSMGRSLKTLLKHIAEDHTELMGTLVELHLNQLKLPENTSEVLRLFYKEGADIKQLALRKGIEVALLKRELSVGKKALVEGLAKTIKNQLHLARFGVQ